MITYACHFHKKHMKVYVIKDISICNHRLVIHCRIMYKLLWFDIDIFNEPNLIEVCSKSSG